MILASYLGSTFRWLQARIAIQFRPEVYLTLPIHGNFVRQVGAWTFLGDRFWRHRYLMRSFIPFSRLHSSIFGLFRSGSPTAVLGFVLSDVIESTDTFSANPSYTHIFEEVLETIDPTIADRGSAATIVLEPGMFRIVATLFHVRPGLINRVAPPFPGTDLHVAESMGRTIVTPKAAARPCSAIAKIERENHFLGTTITSTSPRRSLCAGTNNSFQNRQTVKLLTDVIFYVVHRTHLERRDTDNLEVFN